MTLRHAFAFVALASCLPLVGCVVTQDGDTTTIETATRFEGTPVSSSVAYAPGQAIHILSHNGNVSIKKGSKSTVDVTFSPFTLGKKDQADAAAQEMNQNLVLKAGSANNVVSIEANVVDGSSSGLGADVVVALPSGWSGDFEVFSDNGPVDADLGGGTPSSTKVTGHAGDIVVKGAQGALAFSDDAGNIDVSVSAWSQSDGTVAQTGTGDVFFRLPSTFDGSIQAQASGTLHDSSVPTTTWQVAEAAANSKQYTMGSGAGGNVLLTTSFGDITIDVH